VIGQEELHWRFIRASGPGGQNVNKVSTAVQLRFDAANSNALPEDVRARLMRLAGRRMTGEGTLVIDARRYRTQARNRVDAIHRLVDLIHKAAVTPVQRKKTKPTLASKQRKRESKRRRGDVKRLRGAPKGEA
jgi:ribosome-associated protein